ncbi:hypothetical protein KIN20_011153 [Parelaphostrongylus tenuis]|uniref:Uncharacterized protein n=1 Tax=Parelaphostrongylus tenuis TaxID=148309 RepID=A0AAD5MAM0_PARTN|nr:hypothetical protein KIN20_011153 [Parelaphostrongylus tenuis]
MNYLSSTRGHNKTLMEQGVSPDNDVLLKTIVTQSRNVEQIWRSNRFSSIGVDTSDLVSRTDEPSEICHSPSVSSNDTHFSKSEVISEQSMVDNLKAKISELESERESHLVDLSLLRRKLAHLGVKEVKDSSYSEVEMLKQVNRERLRALTDDLQTTQSTANYYKGECVILLRKNSICMNEKRILEEKVEDMTKKNRGLNG